MNLAQLYYRRESPSVAERYLCTLLDPCGGINSTLEKDVLSGSTLEYLIASSTSTSNESPDTKPTPVAATDDKRFPKWVPWSHCWGSTETFSDFILSNTTTSLVPSLLTVLPPVPCTSNELSPSIMDLLLFHLPCFVPSRYVAVACSKHLQRLCLTGPDLAEAIMRNTKSSPHNPIKAMETYPPNGSEALKGKMPNTKKRKYIDEYLSYGFMVLIKKWRTTATVRRRCHSEKKESNTAYFEQKVRNLMRQKLHKKPHRIAEELILPCTKEMVLSVLDEDATRKISDISVSNNTIRRSVADSFTDLRSQSDEGRICLESILKRKQQCPMSWILLSCTGIHVQASHPTVANSALVVCFRLRGCGCICYMYMQKSKLERRKVTP
ncbi:Zinc finger BED domain-containing protein 5 [Trichinella zimbabwensis]|uniref:Zinc finger BED domain-containing protein 5 n=1 Tax=Trichinella zimbabwensis TaxID=268475 RepID=A0A0V1HMH8_9BILA|nr:Zinc finger BED domain-containing protein 5 [Trichinella zimbabwensis]